MAVKVQVSNHLELCIKFNFQNGKQYLKPKRRAKNDDAATVFIVFLIFLHHFDRGSIFMHDLASSLNFISFCSSN